MFRCVTGEEKNVRMEGRASKADPLVAQLVERSTVDAASPQVSNGPWFESGRGDFSSLADEVVSLWPRIELEPERKSTVAQD